DPCGDDDDIPGWRLGRRFPLAVHDADLKRSSEDGLGDRPDRERLPGPGPRDDSKPSPRCRQARDVGPVLAGEERIDIQAHRQLDRLTCRARRSDHDDAPGRGLGGEEGVRVGGKKVVPGDAHDRNIVTAMFSTGARKRKLEACVRASRLATVPAALSRTPAAASGTFRCTPHSGGTADTYQSPS